jgi:hypothetical protein
MHGKIERQESVPSKSIQFFATENDLSAVLDAIEAHWKLQYVECGLFDDADRPSYNTFRAIPKFAKCPPYFLLLLQDSACGIRSVPQRRGGVKYAVDQLANPASAVLKPGLQESQSVLIAGSFGTTHSDKTSSLLARAFITQMKTRFRRVKSYWIGEEALAKLAKGARLTINVNAAAEYDLSL